MKLGQAIKMAVKSILAKKGRSFLTMLGIIIGIAAVMTIVSVVEGYNRQMMDMFNSMGTNLVQVSAQYNNGESMFEPIYNYCQRLGDMVVGVSPMGSTYGTVKYGAKTSDTMDWQDQPRVYLGGDQYSLCADFAVARGRDLSRLDIDEYHQVCVLGSGAAKVFFDYADPLGQDMTINGLPFRVVGVYREKGGTSFGQSPDNVIVLPYSCARFFKDSNGNISEFAVKVKDSQHITEVITRVGDYVNSLTKNQTVGYGMVYSESTWAQESNNELNIISLVLGGIAGISLLVGGIGIMNIMLVTVTERTREIGIRRAIGAERSSIVTQFLVEAGMICGIGGVFGIAIGFLGTSIAGQLILKMSVLPTPVITLGAFVFSVVIGIIFGMYPAIKASGLQPVVALRAE